MKASTVVKAPGKILWIGGYSVLERPNIALVTTVNAYVSAEISRNTDQSVTLRSPHIAMHADGTIDPYTGKISVSIPKELALLKTAAEVAARYAAEAGARISGFDLTATNDRPFSYDISSGKLVKSGLGSSAAVTVAAVSSILKEFGVGTSDLDTVNKLAQIAHSLATGKVGSGFDIAAATYGSILYTRYSPEMLGELRPDYQNQQLTQLVKRKWDCSAEKFDIANNLRLLFANFVGESMSTTKALGSVSQFKLRDPHTYAELIGEINEENKKAVKALRLVDHGGADDFREAFDRGRSLTRKLGLLSGVDIEPDDCSKLIEQSKQNGALVARLPGAGGRDAIAALCDGDASRERLRKFWLTRKELDVIDLDLSRTGVA